jgi:RNase adaptor protein for sRNA GlmZ degradation
MTAYLTEQEIKTGLQVLVKEHLENCKNCQELSDDFVELIRHTLKAKYAHYNKDTRTIEIGVKQENENSFYKDIKTYSYSLKQAEEELGKSFKNSENQDLQFYGKLINGTRNNPASEVIVIS